MNTVLRNKNFKFLWGSQIFSQLTIQLTNFLLLISIYEKTNSTIATSFLWVILALPAVLAGPFAAALADMTDRRSILRVTTMTQAVSIFVFSFFYERYLYLTYAVAFFYSLINQFYIPAEASSLPVLVNKKGLPSANALFFLTQQASIIVGAGCAGIIVNFLGFEVSIRITSFFLLLAFIFTNFLPSIKPAKISLSIFEQRFSRFFERIVEGYKFVKEHNLVKLPFFLLLGLQVILAIVVTNLPVLSQKMMHINPRMAGLFMIIPATLGAIVASFVIPRFMKNGQRKKWIIESSLVVMAFSLFTISIVTPLLHKYVKPVISLLSFALVGYSYVGVTIPAQTFLQEVTPKRLTGRVFGNFWFLAAIAMILPTLFSATITEVFGVGFLVLMIGILPLGVYIFSRRMGDKLLSN